MPRIDFDYDDLGQFDPTVQEALLRLHRQQEAKEEEARVVPQHRPLTIIARHSGEDEAKKHALQRNTSGGINLPDYRGVLPATKETTE